MINTGKVILDIQDLNVSFRTAQGRVHAVRGLNFTLKDGETAALAGESGSGKTAAMRAVLGLLPDNASVGGKALYYGEESRPEGLDLLEGDQGWLRTNINGRKIAMVFKDPMASLNPAMTVGRQIEQAVLAHEKLPKKEAHARALAFLREAGIREAARRMRQYPDAFSAEERQRIAIATALSCNPGILILDEPTETLELAARERVMELISSLQRSRRLSVVLLTRDPGLAAGFADSVYVLYAGRVAEQGTVSDIFHDPRHPYTWGLLLSATDMDFPDEEMSGSYRAPYTAGEEIRGDAFSTRNPWAMEIDFEREAPLFRISDTHFAASWLLDPRAPKVERPEVLERRIRKMKKEAADYVRF